MKGVVLILLVLPLYVVSLLPTSIYQVISWDLTVVDDYSVVSTGLAPYCNYSLRVRVKDNDGVSQSRTESMISSGEIPSLLFIIASPISLFGTTSELGTNFGWYIRFQSQDEGIVQLMVYSRFSSFFGSPVENTSTTFNVNPFRKRTASGQYQNLIGDVYTNTSQPPLPAITVSSLFAPTLSQTALAHFVTLDPASNYIAFSDSNFQNFDVIHPDIEGFNPVCETPMGIKSGYLSFDRVLLNTAYGVLSGSLNSSRKVEWQVELASCVIGMTVLPLLYSFGADLIIQNLQYSFAFGASLGLWISIHPLEPTFSQIVDTQGVDLAGYMNQLHEMTTAPPSWVVVEAAVNDVFTHKYLFLVNCSGSALFESGTVIIQFTSAKQDSNCCRGSWSTLFVFPSRLPLVTSPAASSSYPTILRSDSKNSGVELIITGMQFLRGGLTPDLFLWGNALLFSPDNGFTIFVLTALTRSDDRITSFASSLDGTYVFATSYGQLYVGQLLSQVVAPVFVPAVAAGGTKLFFFNANNQLYSIGTELNTQLSPSSIVLDTSLVSAVVDTIKILSETSKVECSYENIAFAFDNDPAFSRSVLPLSASYPPALIFIDFRMNYSFSLILTPTIPLYDIFVSFRFPQTEFLDLEFTRVEDYSASLVYYNVTVRDLGNFGKQLMPGADLQPSPLQIRVSDASLECGASTTNGVFFYTGCPPGRIFEFDSLSSRATDEGCSPSPPLFLPCTFFGNKFHPLFQVVDTFTGTNSRYNGLFSFEVVGGGETLESIRNFTEKEIADYNSGSSTIWAPVHDMRDGGMYTSTGIFWLCTRGSPCGNLFPHFPHTPEYLLLIRATALNSNSSYCSFSTSFLLRLHTINLSLGIYILVFFATLLTLLLGFALSFFLVAKYRKVWLLGFNVAKDSN